MSDGLFDMHGNPVDEFGNPIEQITIIGSRGMSYDDYLDYKENGLPDLDRNYQNCGRSSGGGGGGVNQYGVREGDPIDAALDYLIDGSPTFRDAYKAFARTGAKIVFTTAVNGTRFDWPTNTVIWNPADANETAQGVNSTALSLAHEMGHAIEYFRDPVGFVASYKEAEESISYQLGGNSTNNTYKVATEEIRNLPFEQAVARELGEPVREKYVATSHIVDSVTYSSHSR
jgi:hypothetical protein